MHKMVTENRVFQALILAAIFCFGIALFGCVMETETDLEETSIGVGHYPVFPSNVDMIHLSSASDQYLYGSGTTSQLFIVCVWDDTDDRWEYYDSSWGMTSSSSYNGVGINGTDDSEYLAAIPGSTTGRCYYPDDSYINITTAHASWVGTLWIEMDGGDDQVYHMGRQNNSYTNVTFGNEGNDYLYGSDYTDWLYGGNGEDTIYAYGGNDVVYGEADDDPMLDGGDGPDLMVGGGGDDTMYGGNGADTMYGYPGDDIMLGEELNDKMYGGSGYDTMNGGTGYDLVDGQGDEDDCVNGPNIRNCEGP